MQQLELILYFGLDPIPLTVTKIIGVVYPRKVSSRQEDSLAVVGEVIARNLQSSRRHWTRDWTRKGFKVCAVQE